MTWHPLASVSQSARVAGEPQLLGGHLSYLTSVRVPAVAQDPFCPKFLRVVEGLGIDRERRDTVTHPDHKLGGSRGKVSLLALQPSISLRPQFASCEVRECV